MYNKLILHRMYMKRLLFLLTLLFCMSRLSAQVAVSADNIDQGITISCGCSGEARDKILVVVNGKAVNGKYLNSIPPSLITEISVLKVNDAVKTYGAVGKYGALLVRVKRETKWVKVSKLLKKNKINASAQNLPILYNSSYLKVDTVLIAKRTPYLVSIVNSNNLAGDTKTKALRYLRITETKNEVLL